MANSIFHPQPQPTKEEIVRYRELRTAARAYLKEIVSKPFDPEDHLSEKARLKGIGDEIRFFEQTYGKGYRF